MGSKKGTRPPNAGKGRPKGSLNKSTKIMKDVFAELYAKTSKHFDKWIYQVADGIKESEPVLDDDGEPVLDDNGEAKLLWNWLIRPDPHAAAKLAFEAAEFHRPKLARTELTGPKGEALAIAVKFVSARKGN